MSTYAIGDLQGCFSELNELLDVINFNSTNDQLWFVGDIINRGPESLACLRFVKSLGDTARIVLGNHDLHLLAVANDVCKPHKKDTLDDILNADDSEELLNWMRHLPLLVNDNKLNFVMVHAGLPPQWTLKETEELAQETEVLLRSDYFNDFMKYLYGDEPDEWAESLKGYDRHRYIINALTRIRYCYADGRLNLRAKNAPGKEASYLIPWYSLPNRQTNKNKIIFGHWSTVHLGDDKDFKAFNVYPLDTGCLWGGDMTAMRLEDEKKFSVTSRQSKSK